MSLDKDSPEYKANVPEFGSHVDSGNLRQNFKALEHYDQGRVLSLYDLKAAEGVTGSELDDYKHRLQVNSILFSINNKRINLSEQQFKLTTSAFSNFDWPTGTEQRLDLLYIDRDGNLGWKKGSSPHLDKIPDRPQGSFPIAAIEIRADMNPSGGNAAIKQTHIHDIRFSYLQSNVDQMMSDYSQGSLFRVDGNGNVVEQPQGDGHGLNADTVDNMHAQELQSGIAQWNSSQEGVDLAGTTPYINTNFSGLKLDGTDSMLWLNGQQLTFGVHYQVDSTVDASFEIIDGDLLPLSVDDVAHALKLGVVNEDEVAHAGNHVPSGSDPISLVKDSQKLGGSPPSDFADNPHGNGQHSSDFADNPHGNGQHSSDFVDTSTNQTIGGDKEFNAAYPKLPGSGDPGSDNRAVPRGYVDSNVTNISREIYSNNILAFSNKDHSNNWTPTFDVSDFNDVSDNVSEVLIHGASRTGDNHSIRMGYRWPGQVDWKYTAGSYFDPGNRDLTDEVNSSHGINFTVWIPVDNNGQIELLVEVIDGAPSSAFEIHGEKTY